MSDYPVKDCQCKRKKEIIGVEKYQVFPFGDRRFSESTPFCTFGGEIPGFLGIKVRLAPEICDWR